MKRVFDIKPLPSKTFKILIDGESVLASSGETVLAVLMAAGIRNFSKNDYNMKTGSLCGMGICQSCLVVVDGIAKIKACQKLVSPGMKVETHKNLFDLIQEV